MDDVYSVRDIAQAAGAHDDHVRALAGGSQYVSRAHAVRLARSLINARVVAYSTPRPPFSVVAGAQQQFSNVPVLVASTVHVGVLLLIVLIASFGMAPKAAILPSADDGASTARMIFLALPGPGGGGGGSGQNQPKPPEPALAEGDHAVTSPARVQPPPQPAPLLQSESLPVVIAPIVTSPADSQTRIGVLEQTTVDLDSRGPGQGGAAGAGAGTGIGDGSGNGVGAGSGGGTGGGPYRAGSGVEPPRLLQEFKADYTEEARQRGLSGEVVMEIVVRRDGTVGDVKVVRGLGSGLNERAVDAVRRWRFSPARRLGSPVDVFVEVAVEFKLR
jgi:TonB family protein